MDSEATSDKLLFKALANEGPKPPKVAAAGTKECKYGSACAVTGCQFKHPGPGGNHQTKAHNRQPGKPPPKSGGKPDPKSPKPKHREKTPPPQKKNTPCYNLGACPKSEAECPLAHRVVTPDEKAGFDKYKADAASAKATSKAKAKSAPS
jgi:hypothetical protein